MREDESGEAGEPRDEGEEDEPEADYEGPAEEAPVAAEPESAASEADDRSISDSYTSDSSNPSPTESESPPAAPLPEVQVQTGRDSRMVSNIGSIYAVFDERQKVLAEKEDRLQRELEAVLKDKVATKQKLDLITTVKKEMAAKDELKRRRDSHPNINLQQAAPVSPA